MKKTTDYQRALKDVWTELCKEGYGNDLNILATIHQLQEKEQAGINTNVGGPSSAVSDGGEQLPAEGQAQNVSGRCDCGNYKDPDDSGMCDNCFGYA